MQIYLYKLDGELVFIISSLPLDDVDFLFSTESLKQDDILEEIQKYADKEHISQFSIDFRW